MSAAMADDFRLTIDFDDEHDGTQLLERLDARRFAAEERKRLGDRVIVSRNGGRVFLYTGTQTEAHAWDWSSPWSFSRPGGGSVSRYPET